MKINVDPEEFRHHIFFLESLFHLGVLRSANISNPRLAHDKLGGVVQYLTSLEDKLKEGSNDANNKEG